MSVETTPSLHREVRRAGGRLHPEVAARRILGARGPVGDAGRSVILALAREDGRLDIDDQGQVVLCAPPAETRPLDEVEFVVVDVETTGSRPGTARITEVGSVRVRDGKTLDTFTELVNPGVPVAAPVRRLTGIHDGMLVDAPPFARIAVRWLDFVGNAILVAHNAPFDLGFLGLELERCGEELPAGRALCTVRLARRLLPELRAHDLDTLAAALGLRFNARHRALGDAEVTARALLALLERARDRGILTLGGLRKLVEGPVPRGGENDLLDGR